MFIYVIFSLAFAIGTGVESIYLPIPFNVGTIFNRTSLKDEISNAGIFKNASIMFCRVYPNFGNGSQGAEEMWFWDGFNCKQAPFFGGYHSLNHFSTKQKCESVCQPKYIETEPFNYDDILNLDSNSLSILQLTLKSPDHNIHNIDVVASVASGDIVTTTDKPVVVPPSIPSVPVVNPNSEHTSAHNKSQSIPSADVVSNHNGLVSDIEVPSPASVNSTTQSNSTSSPTNYVSELFDSINRSLGSIRAKRSIMRMRFGRSASNEENFKNSQIPTLWLTKKICSFPVELGQGSEKNTFYYFDENKGCQAAVHKGGKKGLNHFSSPITCSKLCVSKEPYGMTFDGDDAKDLNDQGLRYISEQVTLFRKAEKEMKQQS